MANEQATTSGVKYLLAFKYGGEINIGSIRVIGTLPDLTAHIASMDFSDYSTNPKHITDTSPEYSWYVWEVTDSRPPRRFSAKERKAVGLS